MDRMTRPPVTVLPDSAGIPPENLLDAPPTHFTHEVAAEQPYYWSPAQSASPPAGTFAVGTKVALLARGRGRLCRVADSQGLAVMTPFAGLKPITG